MHFALSMLLVALSASALPVAAQVIEPQACADSKDMRKYLIENPTIQDAGIKEGVDLIKQYDTLISLTCGEAPPTPEPSVDVPAPPTPPPAAPPTPPAAAPATPGGDS